ncbi:hypothetical protein ACFL21_01485 [Patescibacteria group bacterium]
MSEQKMNFKRIILAYVAGFIFLVVGYVFWERFYSLEYSFYHLGLLIVAFSSYTVVRIIKDPKIVRFWSYIYLLDISIIIILFGLYAKDRISFIETLIVLIINAIILIVGLEVGLWRIRVLTKKLEHKERKFDNQQ